MNMGIKHARGKIVARIDAHGFYEPDYIGQCAAHLIETGAGNVGGEARPMPDDSLVSKLIVFVHESRFGIGVAKFRRQSGEGWVDTVWPGIYWRRVFDEIGFYRLELTRNEDNELNARLRACGYGIYLSPKLGHITFLAEICEEFGGRISPMERGACKPSFPAAMLWA